MYTDEKHNSDTKQGGAWFVVFIAFLGAFVPMSTDLYLPALPSMVRTFNTSTGLLNLTLIFFFIFYAGGMVFWGPLSDKYGRKPILLWGMGIYAVASILCANSTSVLMLIVFRIFQAISAGSAVTVSLSIIKDVYEGEKRLSILALVQSMAMISPVVAPVIGALILKFTSWRGVFWVLGLIGIIAIAGAIGMKETIAVRNTGNVIKTVGRIWIVLKNPGFSVLLFVFSLLSAPLMAYISMSSYIYVDGFGLTEQQYSYFFSLNALSSIMGPLLFLRLAKIIKKNPIITGCFVTTILTGIFLIFFGKLSPWTFALSLLPGTLAGSVIRPPGTNLMLEQQNTDTGSASSLVSCAQTLMGSIGMAIISFEFTDRVFVLGLMYIMVSIISLTIWLSVFKRPFIKQMP